MRDRYYSKVILFGEYSMIFDATALMIPLKRFSAQWQLPLSFNRAASLPSNQSLKRFCQYLSENEVLSSLFDLQTLRRDLEESLFLASNVPSGYGLGSSGTLVAAVYDRYAIQKTDNYLNYLVYSNFCIYKIFEPKKGQYKYYFFDLFYLPCSCYIRHYFEVILDLFVNN